ncbi:MAG: PQQ-dependent catabolism-associated CXXCW motif protein [Ectothiorhodospiraceae bacterium AqS1]|nr:PQQ-dependent catabolism-associated CXXCW motif protein [Ectothiorhodospiraceae bacterium AqS1]
MKRGAAGRIGNAARAVLPAIIGFIALIALIALGSGALAAEPCIDEEPDAYRTENYRSAVPCSLSGVRTLSTRQMQALFESASPSLLIDVLPSPRRPQGMGDDALWFPPERTTITGSVWLPNIGYAPLPIEEESYFKENIERISEGNLAKPMVFFCLEDCWMGWNAARRAYKWGYTEVIWYPDGTDGWAREGLPMESITPAPRE